MLATDSSRRVPHSVLHLVIPQCLLEESVQANGPFNSEPI